MPAPREPRPSNLEPGASAVPPCPHFGPCGGCQLQHLAYPAQLAGKAARLRTLLASTGLALPELQLHPSPPLGYRNRIRLTLDTVDGQLRAGYIGASQDDDQGDDQPNHRQHGATFLPITQCPIAAPVLWRCAEALLALLNHDPDLWLRSPWFKPDQLELFTNAGESRLQLSLYLRSSSKSLPGSLGPLFTLLSEALRAHIPQLAGAGIYLLPPNLGARSRRTEQPRPGPAWGSPGLTYTLEPRAPNLEPLSYWVPRGAFFQVNRYLLPELLDLVCSDPAGAESAGSESAGSDPAAANPEPGHAFDLYAGVGLFSRALARRFAQVTAVEIAEPAASALAQAKLPNLRAVKATTFDFLSRAVTLRDRPSLIVLDPPRTGAGREICALLGRLAAPTLIYVSCSPQVLPADLSILASSGYTLAALHLLDLFPQTTHIEAVAILTR